MRRNCVQWDRFERASDEARLPEVERRAWQEHLWGCAACGAEWNARRELVGLVAALPRPGLSPGFDRRLLAALDRAPARLDTTARRWLRLYWALAALVSAWIVVRQPAARELLMMSLVATGLGLLALELVPLPAVRRLARALGSRTTR